jgi:hypothetical protein
MLDLFLHFVAQHGIIGDLVYLVVGKLLSERNNGGGFAGTGDCIDDHIFAIFEMIYDILLFFTRLHHRIEPNTK